jgi:hypothetical protein
LCPAEIGSRWRNSSYQQLYPAIQRPNIRRFVRGHNFPFHNLQRISPRRRTMAIEDEQISHEECDHRRPGIPQGANLDDRARHVGSRSRAASPRNISSSACPRNPLPKTRFSLPKRAQIGPQHPLKGLRGMHEVRLQAGIFARRATCNYLN